MQYLFHESEKGSASSIEEKVTVVKAEHLLLHLEHDLPILVHDLKVAIGDGQQFLHDGELNVLRETEIFTDHSS